MKTLTKLMLKEEFRMHTSYSSRTMFLAFPVLVTVMAFGAAMMSENILEFVTLNQIILGLHVGSFFYGLSVGAFGFMGREYIERQHGSRNYLVATPKTLPIPYRMAFFGLYVRDVIFYILLILVPITGGLLLSVPFTHFSIISILLLFLSVSLTFTVGISLSYFVSVLYIRSTILFILSAIMISVVFIVQGAFNIIPLGAMMPGLGLQLSVPPLSAVSSYALVYLFESVELICIFAGFATLLIPTTFESRKSKTEYQVLPRVYARLRGLKKYGMLLSKELVDLKRSGTITKMFGLFGVILYSWLNNVDIMDYFNTMPVTVPQVIRTKLIAFLMLTVWISTIFVVTIAFINNQTSYLWLAIPVMLIVSIYVVVAIAYLTGLRTNNLLFDTAVLGKFYVLSFLPIICLDILSFTINSHYLIAIFGIIFVVFALGITTLLFYRGIEEKWGRSDFLG